MFGSLLQLTLSVHGLCLATTVSRRSTVLYMGDTGVQPMLAALLVLQACMCVPLSMTLPLSATAQHSVFLLQRRR